MGDWRPRLKSEIDEWIDANHRVIDRLPPLELLFLGLASVGVLAFVYYTVRPETGVLRAEGSRAYPKWLAGGWRGRKGDPPRGPLDSSKTTDERR